MSAALLLMEVVVAPASAQTPVTACGKLAGKASYRLGKDLFVAAGTCLVIAGDGVTLDLNGHSIRGVRGATAGITSTANNVTIKGPGIVHDFDGPCISLYQVPDPGAMLPISGGGAGSTTPGTTSRRATSASTRSGPRSEIREPAPYAQRDGE